MRKVVRGGSAALFWAVARARSARAIHPAGAAFSATWDPDPDPCWPPLPLLEGGPRFARLRCSRGFGLPEPLPELPSVAIKVLDADGAGRDQDLLLAAAGRAPVLRHAFAPGRSHLDRTYSSVLPFRIGTQTVVLGAVPQPPPGDTWRSHDGRDLPELRAAAATGRLAFELLAATPLGPWTRLGRLRVGAPLSPEENERLCFNPEYDAGGIVPVGLVNLVRGPAYVGSQRARLGSRAP